MARSTYEVTDQRMGKPHPARVVVIGAGISGIAAVKLFRETFNGKPTELVVYEKNGDVGGTWLENRYPGCACDIPAHGYTYSWEGNPKWSGPYVGAVEIFEWYKERAKAYGVFDHTHFQHRVTSATWDTITGKWKLTVENTTNQVEFTDECDVLINAGGFLNKWKWPSIDGLDTFDGHLVHSANWDDEYAFEGKSVGVIGSGSSAIQIVPFIQQKAASLVSFNRSPTWITPEFAAEFAPDGKNTVFSDEQIATWVNDPESFLQYRKTVEGGGNGFFATQYKDSDLQRELFATVKATMERRLGREDLASILVPDFAVGCRRMTPGHGYLEALAAPNATVRGDPIRCVTSTGMEMEDGTQFNFDAILCATGFDTSYRPSFPLIGEDGTDLRDKWKDEPRSYLSVAVDGFPNYFMVTGPNFPIANGSVHASLEQTLRYAYMAVEKIQTQNVKSLSPKPEAVSDFQEHKDKVMEELVWSSECRSWYKNGKVDGPVWGPWPGSVLQFIELLGQPRWEDYKIEYKSHNRFQFLGKGRTEIEETGGDMAWYVSEPERKHTNHNT